MRKKQHETCVKMIDWLKKAHEQIVKTVSVDMNATTDLLTKCQNTAIRIGTIIEESEGLNTNTVKLLEEYCELVFIINGELLSVDVERNEPKQYEKRLNSLLLKIENSLKYEISIRMEAVFLPYKASMWDSLESVWEAADRDNNCDAYVIPIPYYDKNPDGSVREEHYEGDLFPSNVPITHFSEYDFGQHHPDMIFIHNPYDYGNLVTTIHPFFYAEKLKKITDCLIYIPYFATTGGMSSSRAWCPVYEYVDFIAIQADYYKEFYASIIPPEKFISYGSPKFDKVIQKCKHPMIPDKSWEEKIKNRKVFFFNTSLNGMLQDTVTFLRKMQYVFEVFKRHNDLCLLWRPHPLFESTLLAMRPECYDIYKQLVNSFKQNDNWIYDDTASVEDTISICDAYVGDAFSSIVALFGVVGKPLFILDNSITEANCNDYEEELIFSPDIINNPSNQDKYLLSQHGKLLISDDKSNNVYKYLLDLNPQYSYRNQYKYIYEYNNKIYIFPYYGKDIAIIDENKKVKKVKVPLSEHQHTICGKVMVYKNKAFIIPWNHIRFVIFDLDTFETSYSDDIGIFCRENRAEDEGIIIPTMTSTELVFINKFANRMIAINLETLDISITDIDINEEICGHYINPDNPNISWLILNKRKVVVRYDRQTGEKKEIIIGENNAEKSKGYFMFSQPFEYKGKIIIPPLGLKECYVLNPRDLSVKEFEISPILSAEGKEVLFDGWNEKLLLDIDGVIYLKDCKENIFYKLVNGQFVEKKTKVLGDEYKTISEPFKANTISLPYCCEENVLLPLEEIISSTINYHDEKIQIKSFEAVNASPDGDCGLKIYEFLKEKIHE